MYRDTSRDAWESFMPFTAELDRDILRALSRSSPFGLTCQDIEDRLGRTHQAVSGNLRHLVERDLVAWSGDYGQTRSGRRAMRWTLSDYATTGQGDLIALAQAAARRENAREQSKNH